MEASIAPFSVLSLLVITSELSVAISFHVPLLRAPPVQVYVYVVLDHSTETLSLLNNLLTKERSSHQIVLPFFLDFYEIPKFLRGLRLDGNYIARMIWLVVFKQLQNNIFKQLQGI